MLRGILQPTSKLTPKEMEIYDIVNNSSFLNTAHFNSDLMVSNREDMEQNTEELIVVKLDANACDYKKHIITIFRQMEDPYNTEIVGVMDYEQNPSDPTHPQKTLAVSKFESTW